jgi:hypothetical protein
MASAFSLSNNHNEDSNIHVGESTNELKKQQPNNPDQTMQTMKYIWLTQAQDLPDISQHAPFKVLLSLDEAVSPERQLQISNWLVDMGAMHVTIRGEGSQNWKDSIRQTNLEKVGLDEMQPEQFVMITTHPGENLRSIFDQLKKHARHTHVDLEFTVIVHLAEQSAQTQYVSIFSRL